ncbi:hypothetical protein FRC19_009748 [Serendipita sp. 401]|nr:hypothetical protein FRC19_009748 [Serendipita sp. 401]
MQPCLALFVLSITWRFPLSLGAIRTQRFNYNDTLIQYGLLNQDRALWTVSEDEMRMIDLDSSNVYFAFRGKAVRFYGRGLYSILDYNMQVLLDGSDIWNNVEYVGQGSEFQWEWRGLGIVDHYLIIYVSKVAEFGLRYIEVDYRDEIGYLPARTGPNSTALSPIATNILNSSDFIPSLALPVSLSDTEIKDFLFYFTGTTLWLFGGAELQGHQAWIQVDDSDPTPMSLEIPYIGGQRSQRILWSVTDLANSTHRVKVNWERWFTVTLQFACTDGTISGTPTVEGAAIEWWHENRLSSGAIAGIIIGILTVLVCLIFCVRLCVRIFEFFSLTGP